jgi:hypothetical protein
MRCRAGPSAVRCSCVLVSSPFRAPSQVPTCWRKRPSKGILGAVDVPSALEDHPGDGAQGRRFGRDGASDDRAAHEADQLVDHCYPSYYFEGEKESEVFLLRLMVPFGSVPRIVFRDFLCDLECGRSPCPAFAGHEKGQSVGFIVESRCHRGDAGQVYPAIFAVESHLGVIESNEHTPPKGRLAACGL